MATPDPMSALAAQYGQQLSSPSGRAEHIAWLDQQLAEARSAYAANHPELSSMQQAIQGGHISPQELVPGPGSISATNFPNPYQPAMGTARPDLTGLPGNPANQLALQAGSPVSVGNVNPIPATGEAIPVAGMKALPAAGQTSTGLVTGATATEVAPLASQALNAATPLAESAAGGAGVAQAEAASAASTGLLTRINTMFPSLGLDITKSSMMEGAGVAMAGLIAGGFADHLNIGGENSNWDKGITGGIKGLGFGGAAAIALGLTGPVGWAVAGGAALFGIANAVFSGRSGDQQGHRSTIDQMHFSIGKANHTVDMLLANPQFGVDQWTAQQIRTQVSASTQFYLDQRDKAGLNQYLSGLAQTVPSFLMQASQRNQVVQEKLKMQAAFGPVYSAMVDRSANAGQQAYADQMKAANAVSDPTLRASLQTQAAASYTSNQNLLTAQAQQVAMLPGSSGTNPAQQTSATQTSPGVQQIDQNTQALVNQYMTPAR